MVVVGFGGAGAVTAMTAHDAGASVLLVERQSAAKRHPSTYMSGSSIICPSDVETAIQYMEGLYRAGPDLYETDPDVLRVWAEYCVQNVDWVRANGGQVYQFATQGEHHHIPGYEAIKNYRFDMIDFPTPWGYRGHGYGLFTWLSGLVAQRNIDVLYECRARWLLTGERGEVLGVRSEVDGRQVDIRATRGVVLTTGGFEYNEWLKLQYLRIQPTYFYANPDNTGDGVLMTQEVGAALWHMNACSAKAIAKFPDFQMGFPINYWGYGGALKRESLHNFPKGKVDKSGVEASCGVIQVDRDGKRFTNEVWKQHTQYYELLAYDSQRGVYPRVPCYWIFDDLRMNAGQLPLRETGAAGPLQLYPWSQDNRAELERGWVVKADTIEELARKIDLPPDNLKQTLREYNLACETKDDPFGRPRHTLVPLTAPFYAMTLWPGGPNTQGGPRRNARAQVVSVTGDAIPNLYSAGELGSIYGMLYPVGGGNIAECIAFGRIAGQNAAEEQRH